MIFEVSPLYVVRKKQCQKVQQNDQITSAKASKIHEQSLPKLVPILIQFFLLFSEQNGSKMTDVKMNDRQNNSSSIKCPIEKYEFIFFLSVKELSVVSFF